MKERKIEKKKEWKKTNEKICQKKKKKERKRSKTKTKKEISLKDLKHNKTADRGCVDRDEMISHISSECSNLAPKEYKTRHKQGGQGDPLGIVQKIEIWPRE